MSTRVGEPKKKGQKHQNQTVWKFDLHKTDPLTKTINNLTVSNVCDRCKDIISWKIKYGKYKPLTAPCKCNKCGDKTVKFAYHTRCSTCVAKSGICAKCGKEFDSSLISPQSNIEIDFSKEFESQIKILSERKRRAFLRYCNKIKEETFEKADEDSSISSHRDKILNYLAKISGEDENI